MLLALVDCNNFFVSCERAFNPKLEKKPVVVLSSNDGCVIARSQEAKALEIPMGVPAFMYKALFKKYSVTVLSSNFSLYLDMSQRVMKTLERFCPSIEVYSIDEAFLLLEMAPPEKLVALAHEIRRTVLQWTGIPVSIGIASTKTLAKVANRRAKKESGVFLLSDENRKMCLETLAVGEIWGIGRRLSERLSKHQVYTAWQLEQMPDGWLKKVLTVVGFRIALELRGTTCLELHEVSDKKKSLSSAKSFDRPIDDLATLQGILAGYTANLAKELREQKSAASFMTLFLPDTESQAFCVFTTPTNYTPELITYAKRALATIYEPNQAYKKVGVQLGGFVSDSDSIQDFFYTKKSEQQDKEKRLMTVFDAIHDRFGKKSIFFLAERERPVRCQRRSPRYTTRWDELVSV